MNDSSIVVGVSVAILVPFGAWALWRYPKLEADYEAKVIEIERRTGQCGECEGGGRLFHQGRYGRVYSRRCGRCRGSGRPVGRRRARSRRRGRARS